LKKKHGKGERIAEKQPAGWEKLVSTTKIYTFARGGRGEVLILIHIGTGNTGMARRT